MKKFYYLPLIAMMSIGMDMSAYQVTVEWDQPGAVRIGTGSLRSPEMVTLDASQTKYVFEGDEYTELCVFPAEGYALSEVTQSNDPDKKNSITPNAEYAQQSYFGVANSWNGRTINVKTSKINYDGEISVNVVNGADCLNTYLDYSVTEGSGIMRYTYGYQNTLSLTNGDNKVALSTELMKNMTINLLSGSGAKSIYSVTRNGVAQQPIGTGYYMENIASGDNIEIQVFENQEPVAEKVKFTLSYPAAIDGCIKNIFDRTNSKFLGVDANSNFTMPADKTFEVNKGSELQVNFNEGYTLTSFMLGNENITSKYEESSNRIRFNVNDNVTLNIAGEETKYAEVEFTAYVLNADGVRLKLESYNGVANPIKDVTGEQGEAITKNITIPSFTMADKDSEPGADGNVKTVPSIEMTPENTLRFTVKVSEKSPLVYVSPVTGYYIQSVWDSELNAPLNYLDGAESTQRTFYVVAQKLDRDEEFKVEVTGSNELDFTASQFFQRNWDNPSISFAIGSGERTYKYNSEYDNPFVLYPKVPYAGFEISLNGRQSGITKTEMGTYIIDFSQAYETDKYPVPTLKVNAGGVNVGVETVAEDEVETTIYNLQGISVGSDWESLPSGLYIRNGKKQIKN